MLSDDDRELLRLAAIACGELRGEWVGNDAYFDGVLSRWSPLTDDGDALRLAVKLGGELRIHIEEHWSAFGMIYSDEGMFEHHNGDPYAATRRAIVRAAAEIGRQHEHQ